MNTHPEGYESETPLKRATALDAASQTREMGLKIGQTIIRRILIGNHWTEVKFKLLFKGKSIAVFDIWRRDVVKPEWVFQGESASEHLKFDGWFLIKE